MEEEVRGGGMRSRESKNDRGEMNKEIPERKTTEAATPNKRKVTFIQEQPEDSTIWSRRPHS